VSGLLAGHYKQTALRCQEHEVAASAPVVANMTVMVSRQANRPEREAHLQVRMQRVKVKAPRNGCKQEHWQDQELVVIKATELIEGHKQPEETPLNFNPHPLLFTPTNSSRINTCHILEYIIHCSLWRRPERM
jgi:hypothetical protein